ncbi:MAG: hypothetical protein IKT46_00400 [Clostridia bacterium]|nr:hypothetical protein [Clostridia bacterium]
MKKRKEKRQQRVREKAEAVVDAYRDTDSNTDPNGMYTGITDEVQSACAGGKIYINAQNCIPTQDADDL